MLASTEIKINCLRLKFKVLEIKRTSGFGVNSSISFHLWFSLKHLTASSNFPNVYPITATAKHQFPFGQCTATISFQICFASQTLCWRQFFASMLLCVEKGGNAPVIFPPFSMQRSFREASSWLCGSWIFSTPLDGAQGWWQVQAHPS